MNTKAMTGKEMREKLERRTTSVEEMREMLEAEAIRYRGYGGDRFFDLLDADGNAWAWIWKQRETDTRWRIDFRVLPKIHACYEGSLSFAATDAAVVKFAVVLAESMEAAANSANSANSTRGIDTR